jgi:F0F1-type ATP synthase delta subunit
MKSYLRLIIETKFLSQKEKKQLLINVFSQRSETDAKRVLSLTSMRENGGVIRDIVDASCCWENTQQGHLYWWDISERALREELITEEAENL